MFPGTYILYRRKSMFMFTFVLKYFFSLFLSLFYLNETRKNNCISSSYIGGRLHKGNISVVWSFMLKNLSEQPTEDEWLWNTHHCLPAFLIPVNV